MKNLFVLRICTLLVAISPFACSDEKKPVSTETPVTTPVAAVNTGLHPAEQKLDAFMTTYINKLKAAFTEQDDAKSIALLQEMNTEITGQGEALKAELEQWGKSLSEQEKEAVKKRMEEKPYMNTLTELVSDTDFLQRLTKSAKLKEAYENANEGFSILPEDVE